MRACVLRIPSAEPLSLVHSPVRPPLSPAAAPDAGAGKGGGAGGGRGGGRLGGGDRGGGAGGATDAAQRLAAHPKPRGAGAHAATAAAGRAFAGACATSGGSSHSCLFLLSPVSHSCLFLILLRFSLVCLFLLLVSESMPPLSCVTFAISAYPAIACADLLDVAPPPRRGSEIGTSSFPLSWKSTARHTIPTPLSHTHTDARARACLRSLLPPTAPAHPPSCFLLPIHHVLPWPLPAAWSHAR